MNGFIHPYTKIFGKIVDVYILQQDNLNLCASIFDVKAQPTVQA
jgi:hypothetical protein